MPNNLINKTFVSPLSYTGPDLGLGICPGASTYFLSPFIFRYSRVGWASTTEGCPGASMSISGPEAMLQLKLLKTLVCRVHVDLSDCKSFDHLTNSTKYLQVDKAFYSLQRWKRYFHYNNPCRSPSGISDHMPHKHLHHCATEVP